MIPAHPAPAVLHVALNPVTGVWSVMKELAMAQARSGAYPDVGIGIICDRTWPAACRDELRSCELPNYVANTPKAFGTAQFLWQRICGPPLGDWIDDLLSRAKVEKCVVHLHNAWLSGVFLPLKSAQRRKAKIVVTFHGVNAHFRRQPVRRRVHQWMARRLVKYNAALTSVDHANLKRAQTLLKLNPDEFTVIPNGISDTAARACPYLNGARTFSVGHVGSIVPAKGWRILVEAADQLRRAGVALKVMVAGRGSDADRVKELAGQSGGWLTYKGFVANPRETVMKELDALVLMSEQEGLPMAIIEAFSIGLPVIATPVGGVPEAVTNGRNGLLVWRTVDAMTAALRRLMGDRDLLRSMGAQGRRDFEERFEISRIVSRYHAVYQGAV